MENHLAFSNLKLGNLIKGEMGVGDKMRFWIDPWTAQDPLRDLFPNLFLNERDKGCLITSRYERVGNDTVWKWDWKRLNLSQNEAIEFSECLNLVQQASFSNTPDRWVWPNDPSGVFSVNSMKKILFNISNPSAPFILKWNSWVPKKVNIHVWKAEMDRPSTLVALSKRNIEVGPVKCRLCGDYEESSDHLLTSCYFATLIWQFVSN
ncbi:uncharacterized protein LOC143611641 [Bidens hawaiensis]|uniref:uncharacterized protein LOC143611641 n=1 Tax=Bidens hawaiensis TaxID=980011 RepID=UPI00404A724E